MRAVGFALQLRKITENLNQGNRRALCSSAPSAIRLVDLAIAGDGLDWPVSPAALGFRVKRRGNIFLIQVLPGGRSRTAEPRVAGPSSYPLDHEFLARPRGHWDWPILYHFEISGSIYCIAYKRRTSLSCYRYVRSVVI